MCRTKRELNVSGQKSGCTDLTRHVPVVEWSSSSSSAFPFLNTILMLYQTLIIEGKLHIASPGKINAAISIFDWSHESARWDGHLRVIRYDHSRS